MVKKKDVSVNGKTTIAILPHNRVWLKSLGKKGDTYDDVLDAIRVTLESKKR